MSTEPTTIWALPDSPDDTIYVSGDFYARWRPFVTLPSLRDAVAANGGHFFDRNTLRFFGSHRPEVVAGCYVECQRNAPEGVERYIVAVFDHDGSHLGTLRAASRDHARTIARRIHRGELARQRAPWERDCDGCGADPGGECRPGCLSIVTREEGQS